MIEFGDTRIVVQPTNDKRWSWRIQIYKGGPGYADWAIPMTLDQNIKIWGIEDTEEQAHNAGGEAIKQYYNSFTNKKLFKKNVSQNTSVKLYKRSDYIDE